MTPTIPALKIVKSGVLPSPQLLPTGATIAFLGVLGIKAARGEQGYYCE